MASSVVVSIPAPRRRSTPATPAALLRRGFLGAEACAQSLVMMGVSPASGRVFPSALAAQSAVHSELREALAIVLRHPTLATLRDAFSATEAVLAASKRATRSMVDARSPQLTQWALAMAGLRAGLEDSLLLPDGSAAEGNAALVRAALERAAG